MAFLESSHKATPHYLRIPLCLLSFHFLVEPAVRSIPLIPCVRIARYRDIACRLRVLANVEAMASSGTESNAPWTVGNEPSAEPRFLCTGASMVQRHVSIDVPCDSLDAIPVETDDSRVYRIQSPSPVAQRN